MKIVGISFSYSKNSMSYRGLTLMDYYLNFFHYSQVSLPPCDNNTPDGNVPSEVTEFCEILSQADAVVFSIPEYSEQYSAAFKNAMDWLVVNTNLNSTLSNNYSISGKPVFVITFTPANPGAGNRHFDVTSKLLLKLNSNIIDCFVKNNAWDNLLPGNVDYVKFECQTILQTVPTNPEITNNKTLVDEVPDWIKKYNKWNNAWKN